MLVVVVFVGCTKKEKYPIQDLELEPAYNITLLNEIKGRLEETGKNQDVNLLYKKLFISQQLRWPEDESEEIRYLIDKEGLNYELYQYAVDFYTSNHYYEKLLNLVNKWLSQHKVTSQDVRYQIVALKGLNRETEAKYLLWNFLQSGDEKEDLVFIANQYLDFQDTARAIYTYSRLARFHPQEKVLRDTYIPLLIEGGYPERARDLLQAQSQFSKDKKNQALMARVLYDLGEPYEAIAILRRQEGPDAYLQIANWYKSLSKWDSAIFYTNRLIERDSSREALLIKGGIYEQRGWLNTAYQTFEALVRRNPTDSIAINKAEIVARKIAYLRRKREEEEKIPVLEIPIKKSTENE